MAFNFGDFFMGTEGTPGEHGIDTTYLDDYGDYQGMRDQMNDYWTKAMNFEESPAMQNFAQGILQNDYAQLNREYLGDPGNRGNSAMGLAEQMGAGQGIGAPATNAQMSKVNYELQAKKAAARAAMNKYRMDYMGQAAMQAPMGMAQLPQGQRTYSSAYNVAPTAGSTGYLGEQFANVMSGGVNKVADIFGAIGGQRPGGGSGGYLTTDNSGFNTSGGSMFQNPTMSGNTDLSQFGY